MPTDYLEIGRKTKFIEQEQAVAVSVVSDASGTAKDGTLVMIFPRTFAGDITTDTTINLNNGATYTRASLDCYYINELVLAVGADQELSVQPQISADGSTWRDLGTATNTTAGKMTIIPATLPLYVPTRYFRYTITNNSGTATTWLLAVLRSSLML